MSIEEPSWDTGIILAGAIKRVLSEHTAILGANIKCQCGATSAIPAEHAHHVADVLVSELGLVLS